MACRLLVVASLLVVPACSGDDNKDQTPGDAPRDGTPSDQPRDVPRDQPRDGQPTGGQPQAPPVTIRGGERIMWSQAAVSVQELQSLRFNLYVDGRQSVLASAGCSATSGPFGYDCSGVLPSNMSAGQHSLEMSTTLNGLESLRSASLLVMVTAPATSSLSLNQSAPLNSTICVGQLQAHCYSVQVFAGGLDTVSALTPLPDGRLMFIEGGQRVRVVGADAQQTAIALPAEADRQLTGLALDSQFEKSRSVFVAWTEFARGVPGATITRYRELENVLGEGAAIATGLPAVPDSLTPLAVDNDGLVYIAAPFDPNTGLRFLGNAGVVMRVDRDGRVPPSNQNGSPIVAVSYAAPRALAIEPSNGKVWLAGSDQAPLGDVAAFDIRNLPRVAWPLRPGGIRTTRTDSQPIDSLTIVGQAQTASDLTELMVARGGRLQEIWVTGAGVVTSASDIPLSAGYVAHSVASDQKGTVYVSGAAPDGSSTVLKIERLQGGQK